MFRLDIPLGILQLKKNSINFTKGLKQFYSKVTKMNFNQDFTNAQRPVLKKFAIKVIRAKE